MSSIDTEGVCGTRRTKRISAKPTSQTQLSSLENDDENNEYAFCGLYSINNALQHYNFLTPEMMEEHLDVLGQEHGDKKYGGYSIQCLHRALQQHGYQLLYLNKMATYKNVSKKNWYKKIVSSNFDMMLIMGIPFDQDGDDTHCIARTRVWLENDTKEEKEARDFYIVCPDYGETKKCSVESIQAFLPQLKWIYAIVPIDHCKSLKRKRE